MKKKIKKVYISGPMTGLDREEYMKRFMLAEDKLHLRMLDPNQQLRVVNPYKRMGLQVPLVLQSAG